GLTHAGTGESASGPAKRDLTWPRFMSQQDFPQDEPDAGVESGRHSRERIAVPTLANRVRRQAGAVALRVLGSRVARFDTIRRLLAPLLLVVVPFYWVVDATQRATLTTIGRDQGIFHYIAWAVRAGDVDYRDVRDVNGPLVHLIH